MWNKVKNINMKAAMRAFAVLWMLVLITVMTITNIGIDETFNWHKWVANAMILFGITVFGLLIGESTGNDFQKERKDGVFQRNVKAYDVIRQIVEDIVIYFPLFYDWYIPQRIEKKNIEFLVTGGMHYQKAEAIVKYCSMDDFAELKSHAIEKEDAHGKKIHIKALLPKEVEPVKIVLNGDVEFKRSGAAYYLQALAESNQADIMEVGEFIKIDRKRTRIINRAVRITSGAIISLAIGILTVNEFMKGNDSQAWVNLVSRITNLFTALFSGYLSGVSDVRKQADAIENKTDVLKMFKSAYDKHLFQVYDEEEQARREYEKYKQEQEEAKKNVIEPEIVQEEKLEKPQDDFLLLKDSEPEEVTVPDVIE